ncbi:MAG: hypothetical protein WBG54_16030 [Acidobacteriaceae bacterium]
MAEYVARVELKGDPPMSSYDKLHKEMAAIGFHLTIDKSRTSAKTTDVEMPHATYFGFSDESIEIATIRKQVFDAAQKVQKSAVVFVAEISNWGWQAG